MLAPPEATCVNDSPATLDYWLAYARLAQAPHMLEVSSGASTRPHRPVRLTVKDTVAEFKVLRSCMAPDILMDVPYCPVTPPTDWGGVRAETGGARERIAAGEMRGAQLFLDAAFDAWALQFEVEAMMRTGQEGQATLRLGRGPRLRSVPLLPKTADLETKGVEAAAALANLQQRITELRNLAGSGKMQKYRTRAGLVLDLDFPQVVKERAGQSLDHAKNLIRATLVLLEGGPQRAGEDGLRVAYRLGELARHLSNRVDGERKREADTCRARWNQWKEAELSSAAGRAFKFAKLPDEWRPPEAARMDGTVVDDSLQILEAEHQKLCGLWEAAHVKPPGAGDPEWMPSMGRPEPAQLRRMGKRFKKFTGNHPDCIKMRHILLLPDVGLECLADILEIMDMTGLLPTAQQLVTIHLYPKPQGGTRPIGLYPFLYRLWARLRQPMAAAWEREHMLPCFAAAKGRSPVDPAWRAALRSQAHLAKGEAAAQCFVDFQKCMRPLTMVTCMPRANN